MPSLDGLTLLTRATPLSQEELVALLEIRRRHLLPYFANRTLPELGDVKCMRSEHPSEHSLRSDCPLLSNGDDLFSLQGIFGVQPFHAVVFHKNSGYRPWEPGGVNIPDGTRKL